MSLGDALRDLARDGRPLDWDAWFPVAQATANDPQTLLEAVGNLSEEDQYALLDRLKADGGPLADYLLVVLAASPVVFGDDQVRAYALADSSAALARRQVLLSQLAESLRANTDQLLERRQPGFDLASEVSELEKKRNQLRAEQLESGHHEMSELEWEITRLEILQSRLADYDPDQRRAYRDDLRDETGHLQQERQAVEDKVARCLVLRDEAQVLVDNLQSQQETLESQHADLLSQQTDQSSRMEELKQSIADLRASTGRAAEQVVALVAEQERLQQSLQAEEQRLEQLSSSPVAEAADHLRSEVRKLYQQLPADDADPMFTQPR